MVVHHRQCRGLIINKQSTNRAKSISSFGPAPILPIFAAPVSLLLPPAAAGSVIIAGVSLAAMRVLDDRVLQSVLLFMDSSSDPALIPDAAITGISASPKEDREAVVAVRMNRSEDQGAQ